MPLLGKLVKADAKIEYRPRRNHVRVINVATIIRAIFESLSNRGAVDKASLIVRRPVVAILGIKAVIVLPKDRLAIADLVIDTGKPGPVFLVADDVGKIIVLRAVGCAGNVRQRKVLRSEEHTSELQ